MSPRGERWLIHPCLLRQSKTVNSPADQDNFHVYLQNATAILCELQEEGDEALPEVRV